ncbi:conjugal transfer protein [Salmonella enterica]
MKKTIVKAALLSLAISTGNVSASGIPTVDAANLAQVVLNGLEAAQHAKDQMNAYTDMMSQAQNQFEQNKDLISGNWKLGDFLDSQLMNSILPNDWENIYNNVTDLTNLRDKFGLKSDDPVIQKQYDKLLAGYDVMNKATKANNQRVENLQKLGSLLNSANTPQQKEDLNLRFQMEYVNMQNEQNRLNNISMLMENQKKLDEQERIKTFKENMRK